MNHLNRLLIIVSLVLISTEALATKVTQPGPWVSSGEIIDKYEPEKPETLFKQMRRLSSSEKGFIASKVITSPEGEVVAEERFQYAKSGRVVRYDLNHMQIGAKGHFEVKGDTVSFHYEKDGKVNTDTEVYKSNFVSTDEIAGYLQARWKRLLKGEDIDIRLPVLDRQETVGFSFYKIREEVRNGEELVVIKMKPSSFIIAALVDPLFFYFKKKGWHELIEVDGRALPKIKKDGKWKDLDAILKLKTVQMNRK